MTLTTSAFAERVVHEMLVGGHFRKHVARIRDRLDARRARVAHELERAGWRLDRMPDCGLFLWARHPAVDDSLWIAQAARREGMRLAPGASFRPHHDAKSVDALQRELRRRSGGVQACSRVRPRSPAPRNGKNPGQRCNSEERIRREAQASARITSLTGFPLAIALDAVDDFPLGVLRPDPAGEPHPLARLEVLVVLEEMRDLRERGSRAGRAGV